MLCGLTIFNGILVNIPIVGNILLNIVYPTQHCHEYEQCYERGCTICSIIYIVVEIRLAQHEFNWDFQNLHCVMWTLCGDRFEYDAFTKVITGAWQGF